MALIPGFEDCVGYRVSNTGSVETCRNKVALGRPHGYGVELSDSWKPLKEEILKKRGYHRIELRTTDKHRKRVLVHRLVLLAFVGPPAPGQIGLHKDDDPDNNVIKNLRWGSYKDNTADCHRNGRSPGYRFPGGEAHPGAKLTTKQAQEIAAKRRNGSSLKQLATEYDVRPETIYKVASGRSGYTLEPVVT